MDSMNKCDCRHPDCTECFPGPIKPACSRCLFFQESAPPALLVPGEGKCLRSYSDAGAPEIPDTPMVALDVDCYQAWLLVRPDFYCAAFCERK